MLEQKNYTVAAELQKMRDLLDSGSALGGGSQEVQELKEEITRQQNTIQTLQMQHISYQSTHQQMEQEITALEGQNTSHQEQVIALQSTKDELQQHINTVEQEKAMLNERLRQLQQSGGVGSADLEVSSLRDQLNQVTIERDNIKKQMAITERFKTLLEGENYMQKTTIATLQAQVAAGKEAHDGDSVLLQAQLASAEEILKKAIEECSVRDTTITDLSMRMLELQQTRGQLEKEVVEMREQKEKILAENAQLREVATQPTKYEHAVKENKQLKQENQELVNALERAQIELRAFEENSMALKEQLDKATDQVTLDAITDKMSKYKGERDDARAQVQALQEQLQSGGAVSGDVISKMSRYRDERNDALVQVQTQQVEIAKLNAIIAQMASTQAAQPMAAVFNRQTSDDQMSSLPSSVHGNVFASETDQRSSTSDVPSIPGRHSDKGKVANLSTPKNPTPSKTSPQSGKKLSMSGGATRQPIKRTSKSVIKQVVTDDGEESVSCEPISSPTEVKKGQRVVVSRTNSTEYGTVRAGYVTIDGKRNFTGVEMDLPSMCIMHKNCIVMLFSTGGTTDGQVKGVRHFKWLVILVIHIACIIMCYNHYS